MAEQDSALPDWVSRLDLAPHPEGGWFRETWRSDHTLDESALPPGYTGARNAGTAILFALMADQQSAWHTVRGAELWLHHRGSPIVLEFGPERTAAREYLLGPDVTAGQHPQLVVPPGYWQRARPRDPEPALVSCIVVPGFDFADFALHDGG